MPELRKEKLRYFQALSEQPSNTKKTWKERNRLLGRKHRCGVESLRTDTHAEVLTDKQAIVEKFGDYFLTVVGMTDAGNCIDSENDVCRLIKTCDSRLT